MSYIGVIGNIGALAGLYNYNNQNRIKLPSFVAGKISIFDNILILTITSLQAPESGYSSLRFIASILLVP